MELEAQVHELYHKLTRLLIDRGLTITTMESATAGLISSLITDTEGSSAILRGAFVTYCNEAKILQGVPAEIIQEHSVYSGETAAAMASACAVAYRADIGIGITGTMGNVDPANPESSSPGQVYFALSIRGQVQIFYLELPPMSTRYAYKLTVAQKIAEALLQNLCP